MIVCSFYANLYQIFFYLPFTSSVSFEEYLRNKPLILIKSNACSHVLCVCYFITFIGQFSFFIVVFLFTIFSPTADEQHLQAVNATGEI